MSLSRCTPYDNNMIALMLKKEGISVSPVTIWRLKKLLKETSSINALQRSGPTHKLSSKLDLIEASMREDDEATASQLQLLQDKLQLSQISLSTIRKERQDLRWTYKRAAYCQVIQSINVEKRFNWAKAHANNDFCDVIWTDETIVMLDSHKRLRSQVKPSNQRELVDGVEKFWKTDVEKCRKVVRNGRSC